MRHLNSASRFRCAGWLGLAALPRLGVGCLLSLWLFGAALAAEIGPESDWCAIANHPKTLELILRPGEYAGPCVLRRGGVARRPLVIRSADPRRPARIVYDGRTANVIDVKTDHVVISGLKFGPTQSGVDGIRVFAARDITIEDCEFERLGGIAIVANHANVDGLVVRRNVIKTSKATAMYFGCHDGVECVASNVVIEHNYIYDVNPPDPMVGYGIQVKLNSTAVIRNNIVVDTKGPGIMVYGASDAQRISLVERNFASRSRSSSGIVVGGGPAVVRNNISERNAEAGVALENYGQRNLLRRIVVSHNTVVNNGKDGIAAPPTGPLEALLINNAAATSGQSHPFPAARSGLRMIGNLDCTGLPCFAEPAERDFSPAAGSPLHRAAARPPEGRVLHDFFGRPRGSRPTIGAVEQPAGPIRLGVINGKVKRPHTSQSGLSAED